MERDRQKGRTGNGISCPLCRNPDTHYVEESGTWVCNHCAYTWFAIERCSPHHNPET